MAEVGYRVTAAMEAEKEAIRLVTREIEKMNAKKNANVTAVRSWRFKYRGWENRVNRLMANQKADEEEKRATIQKIKDYNSLLGEISTIDSLEDDDDIRAYGDLLASIQTAVDTLNMSPLSSNFTDELLETSGSLDEGQVQMSMFIRQNQQYQEKQALYEEYQKQLAIYEDYETALRAYQRRQDAYEDQRAEEHQKWLRDHQKWTEKRQLRNAARRKLEQVKSQLLAINSNDLGVKIAELDESVFKIRLQSGADLEIATNLERAYETLNYLVDSNLWNQIGRPDFNEAEAYLGYGDTSAAIQSLRRAVMVRLSAWSESVNNSPTMLEIRSAMTSDIGPEPEENKIDPPIPPEPLQKPHRPERVDKPQKPSAVDLPQFDAEIEVPTLKPTLNIDKAQLAQLEDFASGKFSNTLENAGRINELASKIGNDCPKIVLIDTKFNKSGLMNAIDAVEGSWSGFGSQRNSSEGLAAVQNFKSAIAELKEIQSYKDLSASSAKFSERSTQLFVWLSSRWWQNGGNPGGDAHPWRGTHARVLTKPK